MLSLHAGARHPELPRGEAEVAIDGEPYLLDFAEIEVPVARRTKDGSNELPSILRGWFGTDVGLLGTLNVVVLRQENGKWQLAPEGPQQIALQLWRAYSREQIPRLFGMQFSAAIWKVGYVRRSGHIFLLVTLDKSEHAAEFQYEDHFLDTTRFQWLSQNRTSQSSVDGKAISNHEAAGTPVHLFIRPSKNIANRSAPFVYCGDVKFIEWEGNTPVTVRWRLSEPVPERLRESLKVPSPPGVTESTE
jgi:hypothetical protein